MKCYIMFCVANLRENMMTLFKIYHRHYLSSMYEMMHNLAASGHNLYTKCIHVYLQQMHTLHGTHTEVSRHFVQGLHFVRRSDRFWAGLP